MNASSFTIAYSNFCDYIYSVNLNLMMNGNTYWNLGDVNLLEPKLNFPSDLRFSTLFYSGFYRPE